MQASSSLSLVAVAASLLVAGCMSYESPSTQPAPAPQASLAGSAWQLVQFQSSDDAIGTIKPDDPAKYEMRLMADGTLAMKLDCNRASGKWEATPSSATSGGIALNGGAMTRAMCPPGSMDTRIARDTGYIRSYVMEGDMLHLSMMADGGIYSWKRIAE